MTLCGIVVPARNAVSTMKAFLASLQESTYPHWRLFVTDDASTDATPEVVRRWCDETGRGELIRLQARVGPPAARNVGIKAALEAGCSLVVLHDADCVVEPSSLEAHVEAHEAFPDAGIVGGPVRSLHETRVGAADGYASWFTSPPGRGDGLVRFLHLPTCNMSVKPWVFERIGFFDESLATGEDVAFCHQASSRGIPIRFASRACVGHVDRDVWHEAWMHHYRWGAHTHRVRKAKGAFLGRLVPRSARWCRILRVPYAAAFTLLVVALWVPYDRQVLAHVVPIFRLKLAFMRGVEAGAGVGRS